MHSIGSRNITIDRGRFTPGRHTLAVTFTTEGVSGSLSFKGNKSSESYPMYTILLQYVYQPA